MKKIKLKISSVRIARTGMDGGHVYLAGKTSYRRVGDVDIYAFFWDKQKENRFVEKFQDQDVAIVPKDWDGTNGMGVTAKILE